MTLAALAAAAALALAPYVHMQPGADPAGWARETGGRGVTLAFLNADGGSCRGAWPEPDAAVRAQVDALRRLGAGVIVSSGGWNADDLAAACPDPQSLADAYDSALSALGADRLDLDAEAGDVHDNLKPAVVDRRSAALRLLQDRFARRGGRLHVTLTLAVRPAFGLGPRDLDMVRSALAAGVEVEAVNAMVMDYRDGASAGRMGARAILALKRMERQLEALRPGGPRWAMVAATPMIGQNDAREEVFTLRDARELKRFADRVGIARLSYWSLARDNGSCPGERDADPACSGLPQDRWAFSHALGAGR